MYLVLRERVFGEGDRVFERPSEKSRGPKVYRESLRRRTVSNCMVKVDLQELTESPPLLPSRSLNGSSVQNCCSQSIRNRENDVAKTKKHGRDRCLPLIEAAVEKIGVVGPSPYQPLADRVRLEIQPLKNYGSENRT